MNGAATGDTAVDPPALGSQLMIGLWTQKGYVPSPDRKNILLHRFDGFAISKNGGPPVDFKWTFNNRDVQWSPDSKKFLAWTSTGELALFDLDTIGQGGTPHATIVKKPAPGHRTGGIEWAPDGSGAYFAELWDDDKGVVHGSIQRFLLGAEGQPPSIATVLSHSTGIRYFNPPVSRFQNGLGPSAAPFEVFVGAKDGCWLMKPDGKGLELLTPAPADTSDNLEWSPDPKHEKLLINFFAPATGRNGAVLRGLYLVHLDRRAQGKTGEALFEQLHDKMDVHTIWFSPHGKYVTWVTWEGIYLREVDAAPDTVKRIAIKESDKGAPLEIKGCAWNDAETKLAIAASNRLFVYDVAKDQKWTVARCGKDARTFTAEPVWRGDQVVFSTFTDMSAPRRKSK